MIEISPIGHVKVRFKPVFKDWGSYLYIRYERESKQYQIGIIEKQYPQIQYHTIEDIEHLKYISDGTGLTLREMSIFIDCAKYMLSFIIRIDDFLRSNREKDQENYDDEIKEKKQIFCNYKDQEIEQISYVYLLHNQITKVTKIGKSTYPEYRKRTLSSYEGKLDLVKVFKFPSSYQAFDFEKKMHEKFKEVRQHGEWFRLYEKDIQEIENGYNEYMEGL